MLDGLGDDAPGDEGLAEAHFVGDEEAAGGVLVEVEPLEDALDGGALEVLELGQGRRGGRGLLSLSFFVRS